MGSNRSMSRENKKKQLKRQIVPSGSPFQEEEDSREIVAQGAPEKRIRKRLIILAVLAGLAAMAAVVLFRI